MLNMNLNSILRCNSSDLRSIDAISFDRVINSSITVVIVILMVGLSSCQQYQKPIELESQSPDSSIEYFGEKYESINIGTMVWLTRNLNAGKFIESSKQIPNDGALYKYCIDDLEINCDLYGAIYPWAYAVLPYLPYPRNNPYEPMNPPQGICPNGWHIASSGEWSRLIGFCGGEENAASRLTYQGIDSATYAHGNYDSAQFFNLKRFKRQNFVERLFSKSNALIPKEYSAYFLSSSTISADSMHTDFFIKWDNTTFSRHFPRKSHFGSIRCVKNEM